MIHDGNHVSSLSRGVLTITSQKYKGIGGDPHVLLARHRDDLLLLSRLVLVVLERLKCHTVPFGDRAVVEQTWYPLMFLTAGPPDTS